MFRAFNFFFLMKEFPAIYHANYKLISQHETYQAEIQVWPVSAMSPLPLLRLMSEHPVLHPVTILRTR